MINKKQLDFMLKEGEGQYIEYKENVSDLARHIVAFANANGGKLIVGVDDRGKIKNIKITNKLKAEILDIARNCDPKIKVEIEIFGKVLIVEISEGENKPYQCRDGFFLRNGASSEKLKRDDILNFVVREGRVRFDEIPNNAFDFNSDFDKNKIKKYLMLSKVTASNLSIKDLLLGLDAAVIKKGKTILKNAAILFFAKNPQKYFKETYTICVRYKGQDKAKVIDRADFYGDLISQIDEIIKFILKNTRLEYIFTGRPQREEKPEYPMEALRESILNALMHRDYFVEDSNVIINIYDDRLEISNPGGLVKGLKYEDIGKRSVRRNRLISDLFHRAGMIEKIGSGINRIKKLCREYLIAPPEITADENWFDISFPSRVPYETSGEVGEKVGERVGEKVGEKLTNNQNMIISFIIKNKHITIPEISKMLKIASKNVEINIAKLKKKGLINRKGPAKGGYWEVDGKNHE